MSDKVYRIKPLAWEKHCGKWTAKTVFGDCAAWLYRNQAAGKFHWTVWEYASRDGSNIAKELPDLEAAQLAAETWHRERMAAGLVEIQT